MAIRSMMSAISGLRSHQTWMDVIGNNIANLNTTGFKGGRVRFEDLISQTVSGAGGADATTGRAGTDPAQIGLGVMTAGIDTIDTQGALQLTGQPSDLAIQGDGYFIMSDGSQTLYTRDGGFSVGADHKLSNPSNGMYVMGWQADPTGKVDTTGPLTQLTIPIGQQLDAQPSTAATAQGNLDAGAATNATYQTQLTVVDSLGANHDLALTFTKTGNNAWSWAYTSSEAGVTIANGTGSIQFDNQGHVTSTTPSGDLTVSYASGAADTVITGGGDFTGLTQLQGTSNATMVANGSTAGSLVSFTVGQGGDINGVYSNGATKLLGQLALASFANPGGLSKEGKNFFSVSPASGAAIVGKPGDGGHGTVASGYLEMSNVDLAEQFTNMIMAERGFQANSRMITTSDEVLQDLVNMKR